MRVNGKRKFMERAVFAATLLNVYDFELTITRNSGTNEEKLGSGIVQTGPKSFLMDLQRDLDDEGLTKVIGHEMVHLAQFLNKELVDNEDGTVTWKGEVFDDPEFLTDEYFLAPWEMQARGLEEWILHRWENRRHELH